jgi:UDP-N-acetylmuramate dehydrogenase
LLLAGDLAGNTVILPGRNNDAGKNLISPMLKILENIQLKPFNTFGISAVAREFTEIRSKEDAAELATSGMLKGKLHLVLGGGSNILFTGNFDGMVVNVLNKGIQLVEETDDSVLVESSAGEAWHDLVTWTVANGWGGFENLSLIPGSVGAGPVQNIGAYGVELKDCFHSLKAIDLETGAEKTFNKHECGFGYRDSIFKRELKGRILIHSVTFRLSKHPELKLGYGAIKQELEAMGVTKPSVAEVSDAVCRIRRSKLPDPAVTGNAGSFFKNPVVSATTARILQNQYPGMPVYPQPDETIKLAAGWLIEQCGLKGYREDDAGVHPKQALVLVNYGDASGFGIISLAGKIQNKVLEKFGVKLEMEVNVF